MVLPASSLDTGLRKPAAGQPDWVGTPTMLSEDREVLDWIQRHVNPMSHRRRYHTQRASLNLWFYMGRQWIEPRSELAPGNGVYHFQEIYRQSRSAFPRPVSNYIGPSVDNEVARLSRKELVPAATAGKNQPEWMAAARLAKDILRWEMTKQMWGEKRDEVAFNLCIDSNSQLRTYWDENEVETELIAPEDSRRCDGCGRVFASPQVPRSFATLGMPGGEEEGPLEMRHAETLRDIPPSEMPSGEASAVHPKGIAMVEMQLCPFCETAQELKEYPVNPQEALEKDAFGREIGILVPRGNPLMDVLTVHEFFPQNGGISVEPHEQTIWMSQCVRELEFIALRFPEFKDKLAPESAQDLIRLNPLYAEPILSGFLGYNLSTGLEAFYNHARLKEVVILPRPNVKGLERGVQFAVCGEQVARRELVVDVQGEQGWTQVPRVKYHFARFKRIPRNFWGRSFVDDLIPLQRRLNELDAQVVDLRERGKPNMWTPEGTELYTRDDVQGSLTVINYDSPNPAWEPRMGIFPGMPITGNVYGSERTDILNDMQLVGAPQDIEIGQAPGSVKTTSGLMLLSEEASQKRAPRERALTEMYESAFQHILQMTWAFRKEDATYEVKSEGGVYEEKSFTGTDLLGDMRVKMEAEAGYDQTLYNKEAAGEALQMGLYKLDSPAAIDRILDLMKLPKDVNENQTIQVERAEMAWSDFMRLQKVHIPDYSIEDPMTWYAVLGKRWFSDECYILQEKAGWRDVLPSLANWEQKMAEMEAQEAPIKAIYGAQDPATWEQIYQAGSDLVQKSMDAHMKAQQSWQELSVSAQERGEMPPPPPEPPPMQEFPKPPVQPFLPEALNEKIAAVWMRLNPSIKQGLLGARAAMAVEAMQPSQEQFVVLDLLVRMRAVIESYRLQQQQAAMASAMGAPAPPGGPGGAPPGGGAPPPPQ
jgi:hypothetical protein